MKTGTKRITAPRTNTCAPHNPKKKRSALHKAQLALTMRIVNANASRRLGSEKCAAPTLPGSLKVRR